MHFHRINVELVLTKICDFDVEVLVQEEVFWLEIPVHDVVPVAVVHAGDDLLEEPPGVRFLQLQ